MNLFPIAGRKPAIPARFFRPFLHGTALCLMLAACASPGSVRSGQSAVYSTGLSLTLLSWKDGAPSYRDAPASGRWLTAEVRVDYDGNAPSAEIPTSAVRVLWEAHDGSKGEAAPSWVYDPTPGVGAVRDSPSLRVRISNRFTLAFDLPVDAAPASLAVGDAIIELSLPPAP